MPGEFGYDLAIGEVRGTRAWQLMRNKLAGVSHAQVWVPGENRAECRRTQAVRAQMTISMPMPTTAYLPNPCSGMEPRCACGFYAYLRGVNDYLSESLPTPGGGQIGGVIRGWGKTVVGTRGFRTERAEILALYVPLRSWQVVPAERRFYDAGWTSRTIREMWEFRETPPGQVADLVERLGSTYDVPVFTSWDVLLREFPPTEPEVTAPAPVSEEH